MALDPYQICPCGSGKKLKFCCHDLSTEIEKIYRMIDGDQPHAALRHVEAVLAKHAGRASLLDLKAVIQMSLDDFDGTQQTVDQLLANDDQNPTAHALQAIVLTARHQAVAAVDSLQNAMELFDRIMPQRVVEAIGAVGHSLLMAGNMLAARGHLWLYQSISGSKDTRAIELLLRLHRSAGLPLLLRISHPLLRLPDDHPAAEAMENICSLAEIGQWRKAAAQCDEILPQYLHVPLFFYNRALLSGYLGDTRNLVAGLRLYARQEIPHDAAVEAEALAQLLDEPSPSNEAKSVSYAWDISDEDQCLQRLIESPVTDQIDLEIDEDSDAPLPRAVFLLLNKTQPTAVDDLTREQVPEILGQISLYGRQTGRPERVELVTDDDDQMESTLSALRELLGDVATAQGEKADAGKSAKVDPVLSWRWHFPRRTPPPVKRRLLAEERARRLLEVWPDYPCPEFNGKTPREAAKDPSLRLPVEAAILLLEHGNKSLDEAPLFDKLRESLDLPCAEPIDAAKVSFHELPLVRVHRVDLSQVKIEDVIQVYRQAMFANVPAAIRHTTRELMRRDGTHLSAEMFEYRFELEEDSVEAVMVLDKAREWSDSRRESNAPWDLLELQLHLLEQNLTEAQRLFGHLQSEHIHETEVAQRLYQIMYMLGMIRDEDEILPPSETDAFDGFPGADQTDGGIWTPEGNAGAGSSSQKLWLPG